MTIYHIPGEAGRIEADVNFKSMTAPVAVFMHPHAYLGGGMNHPITWYLAEVFYRQGFSTVKFNFRGVGNSEGDAGDGDGENVDAATVMDWIETILPKARDHWIVGHSFGAWIGMQLAARRPEVSHFVALSPPVSLYDFSFLDESFCTARGLIVAAGMDNITGYDYMVALKELIGENAELETIAGSDHFFNEYTTDVVKVVNRFMTREMEMKESA